MERVLPKEMSIEIRLSGNEGLTITTQPRMRVCLSQAEGIGFFCLRVFSMEDGHRDTRCNKILSGDGLNVRYILKIAYDQITCPVVTPYELKNDRQTRAE